jgi:hypothetical protein
MTRSKSRDIHRALRSSAGIIRSVMASEFDRHFKCVAGCLPTLPRPPFNPHPVGFNRWRCSVASVLPKAATYFATTRFRQHVRINSRARKHPRFSYTSLPSNQWPRIGMARLLRRIHIAWGPLMGATADHPPTPDSLRTACGYICQWPSGDASQLRSTGFL